MSDTNAKADDSLSHQKQTSIAKLLAGFHAANSRHEQAEVAQEKSLPSLKKLINGFRAKYAEWTDAQTSVADDFNLFKVLGVEHKELVHSKLLAWFLDPRIEHGSHAQGNLGFRLFLEEFLPELHDPEGTNPV